MRGQLLIGQLDGLFGLVLHDTVNPVTYIDTDEHCWDGFNLNESTIFLWELLGTNERFVEFFVELNPDIYQLFGNGDPDFNRSLSIDAANSLMHLQDANEEYMEPFYPEDEEDDDDFEFTWTDDHYKGLFMMWLGKTGYEEDEIVDIMKDVDHALEQEGKPIVVPIHAVIGH